MSTPHSNPWLTKVIRHLAETGDSLTSAEIVAMFGRPENRGAGKVLANAAVDGFLKATSTDVFNKYSIGKREYAPPKLKQRDAEPEQGIGRTATGRFRPPSVWHYAQGVSV